MQTALMSPEKLGSLIGAGFGLVFVLVNTGSLAPAIAVLLRVLAVGAFVAVVVAVRRVAPATGTHAAGGGFGRTYWCVVGVEVLAIWLGLALLNGPLQMPEAAVGWISAVVGAHFVALAVIWTNPMFHWLGAALLVCGVAGLVLAAGGQDDRAIDLLAGVVPGAVLLGFSLWGSTTGASTPATRSVP